MKKVLKFYENTKIRCIAMFLILFAFLIFNGFSNVQLAKAESIEYSSVLDDLSKDENFNQSKYIEKINDYSLQLIQIAESESKELFIYVYQPSGTIRPLKATSINISTAKCEELDFKNYKLELLSYSKTLFKYKVNNFQVSDKENRYYEISSIFRKWDGNIDDVLDKTTENSISEVSFAVGKAYHISGKDNQEIICEDVETIKITDKYVGFIRYLEGFFLYNDSCDAHYVAFSTDKQIDKLLEADIFYVSCSVEERENLTGKHPEYGKNQDNYKHLTSDDTVGNKPILGKPHTWKRIETVEDFIAEEKLTNEAKNNLSDMKWVLRFVETDYKSAPSVSGTKYNYYTKVSDVSILRLKFETDGEVFNLGVVDNKQTGSLTPDNPQISIFDKIINLVIKIVIGIVSLILIVELIKLIVYIFKR